MLKDILSRKWIKKKVMGYHVAKCASKVTEGNAKWNRGEVECSIIYFNSEWIDLQSE